MLIRVYSPLTRGDKIKLEIVDLRVNKIITKILKDEDMIDELRIDYRYWLRIRRKIWS